MKMVVNYCMLHCTLINHVMKYLEFLNELKIKSNGANKVNLTDPEARRVKLKKGGVRFGYFVQTVCDAKTGFVIHASGC